MKSYQNVANITGYNDKSFLNNQRQLLSEINFD